MKEIGISALEEGQRLDRLLMRALPGAQSSFLYRMLRKKNITLNGRKAAGGEKLQAGDLIRLYFSEETLKKLEGRSGESASFKAEEEALQKLYGRYPGIELSIVYEDGNVLLIDKPAGMLSQKSKPGDISLNEYALGYLLRKGALSPGDLQLFHPSVCNRLDRNTSGIVAVGKTAFGLRELSKMFRERTGEKDYLCLVKGRIYEEAHLRGRLIKEERSNTVSVISSPLSEGSGETEILTFVTPLVQSAGGLRDQKDDKDHPDHKNQKDQKDSKGREKLPPLTLISVRLITGKSHQIRAHLSSIGHPIAGDPKYGDPVLNEALRRAYGLRRQCLHAGMLSFPEETALPGLAGRCFLAPLPEDFENVLKGLGMERFTDPAHWRI